MLVYNYKDAMQYSYFKYWSSTPDDATLKGKRLTIFTYSVFRARVVKKSTVFCLATVFSQS